jgi:hypothetical protein
LLSNQVLRHGLKPGRVLQCRVLQTRLGCEPSANQHCTCLQTVFAKESIFQRVNRISSSDDAKDVCPFAGRHTQSTRGHLQFQSVSISFDTSEYPVIGKAPRVSMGGGLGVDIKPGFSDTVSNQVVHILRIGYAHVYVRTRYVKRKRLRIWFTNT